METWGCCAARKVEGTSGWEARIYDEAKLLEVMKLSTAWQTINQRRFSGRGRLQSRLPGREPRNLKEGKTSNRGTELPCMLMLRVLIAACALRFRYTARPSF